MLEDPVAELLARVADERPTPGAGAVAALTVALSASLVEMVARSGADWSERSGVVAQAACLRARVTPLATAAAEAYDSVLEVLARAADGDARDAELGVKLARAAEVPLRIAECACDVAELAAHAAEHGDPRRRADAVAAALVAEAGARAAAHLVSVNLGAAAGDERVRRAAAAAAAGAAAAARAAGEVP